jgi:hypothetical protein
MVQDFHVGVKDEQWFSRRNASGLQLTHREVIPSAAGDKRTPLLRNQGGMRVIDQAKIGRKKGSHPGAG